MVEGCAQHVVQGPVQALLVRHSASDGLPGSDVFLWSILKAATITRVHFSRTCA